MEQDRSSAVRAYRIMLSLYPSAYLSKHREEMLATFVDMRAETRSPLTFWLWIGKDFLTSLIWQHLHTRSARVALLGAITFLPFLVLVAAQTSFTFLVGPNPLLAGTGAFLFHGGLVAVVIVFVMPVFGAIAILAGVASDLQHQRSYNPFRPSFLRDHVLSLGLLWVGLSIVLPLPLDDGITCLAQWASGDVLTRPPQVIRIGDLGTFLREAARFELRDLGCTILIPIRDFPLR